MPRTRDDDWDDGDECGVREGWRDGVPDDYEPEDSGDEELIGGNDDDNDSDTAPCPKCGAQIYDLSDFCPSCGEAIAPGQQPLSRRTLAIAGVLVVLALLAGYVCIR